MAKTTSFADKTLKKAEKLICPVCEKELQPIKHVKAVKMESGAWKFRAVNTAVCKCNEKEIYA